MICDWILCPVLSAHGTRSGRMGTLGSRQPGIAGCWAWETGLFCPSARPLAWPPPGDSGRLTMWGGVCRSGAEDPPCESCSGQVPRRGAWERVAESRASLGTPQPGAPELQLPDIPAKGLDSTGARWYKLHSKPGKKEKERGEIQLSLQFMRHSLTASMFDLSVKEKPRSPFRRLRDKMKGKHSYDLDSSSAIVPSSSGALDDNFRSGAPKDKVRAGFFFKGQLRRSSLTRSSTSLGSASTLSSASSLGALGSAEGGAPSPSRHSSISTDPAGRDCLPSPQLTHKRAFSDEVSQINLLPEAVQGLKTSKDPSSGSSLCINGSHIYCEEPTPKPSFLSLAPFPVAQIDPSKQERGSGAGLPAVEPDLPPWPASGSQKGPPKDLPRFIPSPPILAAQEEDKLSVKTIALNKQRARARREEGLQAKSKPVPMAAPVAFPPEDERDHHGSLGGHGQSPEVPWSCSGSSRISLRDPGEPVRKPSSQPGLPATPELAKDPGVVSEDQGLPPSIQAGETQPEPRAPPASHLQPSLPAAAAAAAPAHPPVEGDDGFDAFAASRLQPAAPEPEPPPTTEPPGGAAGLLPQQEEGPPSPGRVWQESPDWPSFAFGDRGRAWSGSGGVLLASGTFGEGANSVPSTSSLREEQAQNVGQPGSSVPVAPDVPEEALSWTPESCPRKRTIPSLADPSSEQLDWGREQQTLPQSQPAPQAESSKPSWLPWDPEREEDVGVEEATPTSGGPAQEEQRVPAETEVPRGAGTPPPKPARRIPPLQLTEEANGAGWGTLESTWPRGADPEPPQHLLPLGAADSPPAAAVSLVPAVIIGAGVSGPPKGLPLAAAEDEAVQDDKPGGQEESSGATILATNDGPSAEALPFSTCPSQLSLGGLGLSGVPESPRQDGETGFAPWGLEGAWPTGLPGSASLWSSEKFPRPPEASQGPPEPRVEPSPSLLFWTALEEHRGLLEGGTSLESPCGLGQNDVAAGLAPLHPGHELELPSGGPNDQAMDFRKASFWQEGSGEPKSKQDDPALTPGNPFAPWPAPSPQKNPFVDLPAAEVPWAQAAVLPVPPTVDAHSLGEFPVATGPRRQLRSHSFSVELLAAPSWPCPQPLAFSTPSFQPNASPTDCHLPSALGPPATSAGAAADSQTSPPAFPLLSPPSTDASALLVLPMERLPAQDAPRQQTASPHPVKPMRSTPAPESPHKEKARQASSLSPGQNTDQEQLTPKSAISGSFAASVVQLEKTESKQSPPTKYHHLTREELLQLLLRREAELGKKEEQVRELEGYIDRLLVRIMEKSPTLLQIPLEGGAKATQ
ncbi:rab11 family-interacting protein 5 isoform X2 [Ahaetulla prasina]|uniref:rab11 family-interacting protein 5 isoform X2 n=1 Tax=Ahaetulla prasina TaxID=499056 RepID=UPI00264712EB|nr:rab11 family-interacting protein 5 isoform X2 [Ahaetulla prasina]